MKSGGIFFRNGGRRREGAAEPQLRNFAAAKCVRTNSRILHKKEIRLHACRQAGLLAHKISAVDFPPRF